MDGASPDHEKELKRLVQYVVQTLLGGTEKDRKLLAQMMWHLLAIKSFDTMTTTQGPMRATGQWRTMHDIFFQHLETLSIHTWYAEQFFAYLPHQANPALRGWIPDIHELAAAEATCQGTNCRCTFQTRNEIAWK